MEINFHKNFRRYLLELVRTRAFKYKIQWMHHLANIYLFKVNCRNTRKRYGMCSKSAIKTSKQGQWRLSAVFSGNFEHISHLFLVFLLLNLNKQKFSELCWNKTWCLSSSKAWKNSFMRQKHTGKLISHISHCDQTKVTHES